ncbi:MAG TPA: HlyD family secretion protein [Candidatus Baltobacteraceae bacterium]|nr:HlyD family secretion protein [Candidatus Baltobacteraceae bacterium]
MAAASSPAPTPPASPAPTPASHAEPAPAKAKPQWSWLKYATPLFVVLLALAVLITLTRNWNAWEGGKVEQATDDAIVRGDLTPLSTKVAGIVRSVKVTDYQRVRAGDLLVELQDEDYLAQLAQAGAAVEAAKAAIENNRRQRELQDSRIQRALAGIDLARAQITAAEAGVQAVQADVVRTQAERTRQEALLATQSATKQKVEAAVADQERFAAQEASRKADLEQAKTSLRSNEIAVESERRSKAVLESQEQQLVADLHAKEASFTVAKINLGYTKIPAPADGTVGEKQVRPGQLVSPGTQVLTFVPETKWVQANYRETQLTNMKVGDPAEIRVDQYPGKVFRGKVLEIAPASGSQFALLPPDNATGNYTKVVQRVPVKIAFDDANLASSLRPGLSVIATVRTRQ